MALLGVFCIPVPGQAVESSTSVNDYLNAINSEAKILDEGSSTLKVKAGSRKANQEMNIQEMLKRLKRLRAHAAP